MVETKAERTAAHEALADAIRRFETAMWRSGLHERASVLVSIDPPGQPRERWYVLWRPNYPTGGSLVCCEYDSLEKGLRDYPPRALTNPLTDAPLDVQLATIDLLPKLIENAKAAVAQARDDAARAVVAAKRVNEIADAFGTLTPDESPAGKVSR